MLANVCILLQTMHDSEMNFVSLKVNLSQYAISDWEINKENEKQVCKLKLCTVLDAEARI